MYSGLITEVGQVEQSTLTEQGLLLRIHAPESAARLRAGGSVCVSGVCLTAIECGEESFAVLAGAETLLRSTFRDEMRGRRVNLELPLRAGDPLDGHLVQGHVEGTAVVVSRRRVGSVDYLWLRPNRRLIRAVEAKGSVTVDGVSLTVVEVNKGAFSVALIAETLRRTSLAELTAGDQVNLETDLYLRYIRRFGHAPRPAVALAGLRRGREAVEMAIAAIARGQGALVWDPSREGEGDVIFAGESTTAAQVNFLVTHARGLICVPADAGVLDRLQIERLPGDGDHHRTAFCTPVDACEGTTSGMPASERARTIRLLANPEAGAREFMRPGHVPPLRAEPGGLLARPGHTEAAVAVARWAGKRPVAVCCEVVGSDGEMAGLPELELFAAEHDLPMVAIEDLVEYAREEAAVAAG